MSRESNGKGSIPPAMDEQKQSLSSKLDKLTEITGTPEELSVICSVFNDNIMNLIKFIRGKEPDSPDVNMLNTVVRECINESETLVLDRCMDKIWDARQHIRDKNADYFLERDYSALIKKDQRENFIVTLVSIIKTGWKTSLYDEEREYVWVRAKLMLKCVACYEKWRRANKETNDS